MRGLISRVLFAATISLACGFPHRLKRPTREFVGAGHTRDLPAWPCSGRAVARASLSGSRGPLTPSRHLAVAPVGSYPTLSPLPGPEGPSAVLFLWPYRGLPLQPPGGYPAPSPLEPGLSSPETGAVARPPHPRFCLNFTAFSRDSQPPALPHQKSTRNELRASRKNLRNILYPPS